MKPKPKVETRGRKKVLPENKKVAVTFYVPKRNAEAFKNDSSKLIKKYL